MKNVIKWVAGIVLILSGFGAMVQGAPATAVLYIFAGIICIPPAYKLIAEKSRIRLKSWHKYALVIVPMLIGASLLPTTASQPNAPTSPTVAEQTVNSIGDAVTAGDFSYVVDEIAWKKEIGNEYTNSRADGIYLLVSLRVVNGSKETKLLDNSMFKLTAPNGAKYETSTNAITALEMSGLKSLFLKQCQPGIASSGILVFEVPSQGEYDLHLSSGFWNSRTAIVKLN